MLPTCFAGRRNAWSAVPHSLGATAAKRKSLDIIRPFSQDKAERHNQIRLSTSTCILRTITFVLASSSHVPLQLLRLAYSWKVANGHLGEGRGRLDEVLRISLFSSVEYVPSAVPSLVVKGFVDPNGFFSGVS